MAAEKPRKRTAEQRKRYKQNALVKKKVAEAAAATPDFNSSEDALALKWQIELSLLSQRTRGQPTDADGDIDFAYRNMALSSVTPLMAPSMSGWQWYVYARDEPNKFLEICAKREDSKAKMAGTITNQRMEDDKRQQFAVLDRLEKELTLDVKATIKELMEKFPDDVLSVCRTFDAEWKAFSANHP